MYLSKLEIFGFKSFAQKTNLKFTDGISCVIGPNGSGKSNIVDAIRWVLGEQKSSHLRTDKMENLIFNGTNSRKPLGMAEVSLTVNNNKEVLKSSYTDVIISRRLYRSGESHYLINKTPCRLKDILDLFMDTGMGANSYSVIELNMVEDIISENPADRRHLFEEAAGITKYKTRRKSALRKLDNTLQDMSRISDLISEIQRTVNSLQRQVGKARRYLKHQDELKTKELELARYKYMILMDDIDPLQKQLDEISSIKEDTSHQITLEEALLEEFKREILQIDDTLGGINKRIQDQDIQINQLKEQEAVDRTRYHSITEAISRNRRDIEENNHKSERIRLHTDEIDTDQIKAKDSLDKVRAEFQQIEGAYEKEYTILNEEKSVIEKDLMEARALADKITVLKQEEVKIDYQIQINLEKMSSFENEQNSADKKDSKLQNEINTLTQKIQQLTEVNTRIDSDILEAGKKSEKIESHRHNLSTTLQKAAARKEALRSQVSFFEEVVVRYEGHARSTRFIMKEKSSFQGVHGPLSDLVHVDSTYQRAVETALGDAVNFIVVDDVNVARKLLQKVKSENLGRVSLLPLDRLNEIHTVEHKRGTNSTYLSDIISTDARYESIFQLLLGDCILVDSMDQAISISEKKSPYRYVTAEGEMINAQGILAGGSPPEPEASLIGRSEQIETLRHELKTLEKEISQIESDVKKINSEMEQAARYLQKLNADKEHSQLEMTELNRQLTEWQLIRKTLSDASDKRRSGTEDAAKIVADLKSRLQDLQDQIGNLGASSKELNTRLKKSQDSLDKKSEQIRDEAKRVQDLRVELINSENIYQNRQDELQRNKQLLTELADISQKRTTEIGEMETQLTQINDDKAIRSGKQQKIWEQRDLIEKEKDLIQQKYQELKDKILHLENQIKKYRKQHDTSIERSRQLELNIQENQMKADAILERIREDYNEDISKDIGFEGIGVEEHEQHIESLKYKIKQLGQVNPLAVSEFEKENERLEFYTKQFDDLSEAEKSLRKTINKINVTARKQFMETFNGIKKNFEKVFVSFFENGEGTLKLDTESDPLESNIEIMVRPKGKRLQTISLLSGGEKTLTAISLLFSIYLVKPSPFCILDEIDAPLDDVNVGRFTRALSDFATETQFIVVTHNKNTMEAADTMYGVTMEEEGLSKLVSVKFN